MNTKDHLQQTIKAGFALLQETKGYLQVQILRKMKYLGIKISAATFSNVLQNRKVRVETLQQLSSGIQEIIRSELGLVFGDDAKSFVPVPTKDNWEAVIIPESDPKDSSPSGTFLFRPEGRPSIQEKVDFIQDAQREIVEVGVRLRTFVNYFISRNEHEFALPVKNLMKAKVTLKLYLLAPQSNEALLYFKDRAKVQPEEMDSIEEIIKVQTRIKDLYKVLSQDGLQDRLQVFIYKHIPYNHFLIVDGATPKGKMMVSHYLYGIRRANGPVMEFSKQSERDLYRKYWTSFLALSKEAKRLQF